MDMRLLLHIALLVGLPQYGNTCLGRFQDRSLSLFNNFAQRLGNFNNFAQRLGKSAKDGQDKAEIPMINVPGQRFTATHGIKGKKGEQKLFLFLIEDGAWANYAAISANIALAGIEGGHDKYDLYIRYGLPPTLEQFDYRSVVTASDSYVGDRLYSHDIRIERPRPGPYYLLIQARKSFRELLVTAIVVGDSGSLLSGRGTLSPGDPAAGASVRDGVEGWRYADGGEWQDSRGQVTVTCG